VPDFINGDAESGGVVNTEHSSQINSHLPSRCVDDGIKISHTIDHRDRESEASDEADRQGTDESPGHRSRRIRAFFRHMDGPVDPRVHVVRRNKAGEKDHTIGIPAHFVGEGGPDEFVALLSFGATDAGDENDEEASEGDDN
jgi:hypothetical protein